MRKEHLHNLSRGVVEFALKCNYLAMAPSSASTLDPDRIMYTGEIFHQLPRRFGVHLYKLNAQLVQAYSPPNGNGRYF
jgi:hypothetical protein